MIRISDLPADAGSSAAALNEAQRDRPVNFFRLTIVTIERIFGELRRFPVIWTVFEDGDRLFGPQTCPGLASVSFAG